MCIKNYSFVRFRELDRAAINVDLQMHTTQTDGAATIAELLDKAQERGLGAVAFTEHVRYDTDWFGRFAQDVRQAAQDHASLDVYVGCEAKALDTDGGFDASPAILNACDIVLGSVHRFPDGSGGFLDFDALDPGDFARIELELALGLLRHAPIDVLAHPGGMYQRRHGAFPSALFGEMMEASLERQVAIEINASYLVDMDAFLGLCREINPYVSVGSDVHQIEEMGRCRDQLRVWFGW